MKTASAKKTARKKATTKVSKVTRMSVDPKNPPKITWTPEQRQRLAVIKDEDIDLSDIPEAKPGATWVRHADRVAQQVKEAKQPITIRIDGDVLAVFKKLAAKTDRKYQSIMQDVLRAFAEHQKPPARR
jgi:uncharacterized protein (DUF4415 family)